MKPVIQTEALTKIYRSGPAEVHAVNNVNLSIWEGEFIAVVGPSGSGKTTLLNMIGGLDRPTTGRVWIGDTLLNELSDNQLINFRLWNIGFVFQSYNLLPVLTALENVEFIMLLQERPKEERLRRARRLLEEVGLGAHLHRKPSELSGGQQQRVAVARALAPKPRFILADEPTANLDSASAQGLLDIMEKLNREEQITFIFSTHDPRVIERAKRVITLVDGHIEKDEVQS